MTFGVTSTEDTSIEAHEKEGETSEWTHLNVKPHDRLAR